MKKFKVSLVFWVSLFLCALFVLLGALFSKHVEKSTQNITSFIATHFAWYYLLLVLAILFVCVYLLFSRHSSIILGKEGEAPEFSLKSWFAMLFSAGMGMGLVFWTTAEPLSHAYTKSPIAHTGSNQAIDDAIQFAFFHWGIHAWGVYGIVALVIAYFNFHKGYPWLVSATLRPLFGEKLMSGPLGSLLDILAIIATVTGVAATLGFGALQINQGLNYMFDIKPSFKAQFFIILFSAFVFTWSSWTGISKGIKYLSNFNMILAFIVLVLVFILGPTLYILNTFSNGIGNYIAHFFDMSLRLPLNNETQRTWVNNWTIFYWAWWISWAPFVGIFIARVSRGRTIKEFIIGVLFVPSLVCFIFFAVFGASAIDQQQRGVANLAKEATETATFAMYQHFPLGFILSLLTLVVIFIFFITSADSANYVLGMLSTKGDNHPAAYIKVAWGIMLALFAIIMIITGGTQAIQNMLIIAALPFSVVIIFMVWSLFKALSKEHPKTHLHTHQNTRGKH